MDSGSLAGLSWGAVALAAIVGGAMVWAFVFFLRRNREDLESLEEELQAESRDEEN